jgi:hypothetical protein
METTVNNPIITYNKLIDKNLSLQDRLKSAKTLWDSNEKDRSVLDTHQFIINWIADLLIVKKLFSSFKLNQKSFLNHI